MSNFIVGQITPDLIEDITYGTFIFFGLLTTGGVIFVWFFVPETKRLSLEVSRGLRLGLTDSPTLPYEPC